MTPISSKVVQIVLVIAALVCGAITASYGGVGEAIGVGLILLAVAASPRKGSAVLLDLFANTLGQLSMATRKIRELIDPREAADKGSVYQTEHFFDDQGIRIELCNLNCTLEDRKRVGDFASAFVASMIHQRPTDDAIDGPVAAPTRGDVRGDTRRFPETVSTAG
jgi:hypothetical protein